MTYPALPRGSDSRFTPAVNESGQRFSTRLIPDSAQAENGWIEVGATFHHIPGVEFENWVQTKNVTGIVGWTDKGVFAKAPPKPTPPPPDDEEPAPDISVLIRQHREHHRTRIEKLNDDLEALLNEEHALKNKIHRVKAEIANHEMLLSDFDVFEKAVSQAA